MTYHVPTLDEVRSIPKNGLKVVSTFSGAGGSCLGFRMAGFEVLWANEFVGKARDTYRANFADTPIDSRDIRAITPDDILSATGLDCGELDVLEGSPPCAAFSVNGKLEERWGKVVSYSSTHQRVDDLFWEYGRILKGLQPKVFVAENVPGLLRGVAQGYFNLILAMLRDCGYRVEVRLLDGQWMGVPQMRKRVVFMGVRPDLGILHRWPAPQSPWTTVADGWAEPLPEPSVREIRWLAPGTKGLMALEWCHEHREFRMVKAAQKLWGRSTMMQHFVVRRDHPCHTILQGSATIYHDRELRLLSVPELKRIMSYPDDFVLTGNFGDRVERMGRSVPPLMMRALATEIREMLAP